MRKCAVWAAVWGVAAVLAVTVGTAAMAASYESIGWGAFNPQPEPPKIFITVPLELKILAADIDKVSVVCAVYDKQMPMRANEAVELVKGDKARIVGLGMVDVDVVNHEVVKDVEVAVKLLVGRQRGQATHYAVSILLHNSKTNTWAAPKAGHSDACFRAQQSQVSLAVGGQIPGSRGISDEPSYMPRGGSSAPGHGTIPPETWIQSPGAAH